MHNRDAYNTNKTNPKKSDLRKRLKEKEEEKTVLVFCCLQDTTSLNVKEEEKNKSSVTGQPNFSPIFLMDLDLITNFSPF
jgi:hypothetical protein